jgi:RHS repeat-associated protein
MSQLERQRFVWQALKLFSIFCLAMVCAPSSLANTFTVFGPKTYVRGTGEPITITDSFSVLNPNTVYTLRVTNSRTGTKEDEDGDRSDQRDRDEGVSRAVITVNGVRVVDLDDLKDIVSVLNVPLKPLISNRIGVEVEGREGGTITIQIIGVDNVPPTITAIATPPPNAGGWNNTNVTVSFTCSDATSGLATCPPPQAVTAEGANQVIQGTAVDNAGTTATATITLNIDKTPPTITASAVPAPNAAGWNNTNVTVTFVCQDSLSGVVNCPPPASFTGEGANQTVSGTAVDAAGNTATAMLTLNIDKSAPTITVTSPLNGSTVSTPLVNITGTVTDSLSGVGNVMCGSVQAVVTGSTFTCAVTLVAGTNAIPTQATDVAGNQSTINLSLTLSSFQVSDFNPKSGTVGTLITVTGNGFVPTPGSVPQVALSAQVGGSIAAPLASFDATTLAFVIPTGATTGPLTVSVGGQTATSSVPLVVTTSSAFTLTAAPSAASLIEGQSVSYAINIVSTTGFSALAALKVSGLPAGVAATFSPTQITTGQTSVLSVQGSLSSPVGSSTLSVSASATVDGVVINQTVPLTLNVVQGTTSLVGRTVVDDALETPLAGVTVTMLGNNGQGGTTGCTGSTVSDEAGNFALTGLGPACVGPQLVGYNGLTAVSPRGKYAGVNLVYTLQSGQVTASPVPVHLPRIDNAEAFLLTQNASSDQTYTWKTIPGLSVTVYAHTTFTLPDGSQPDPFPLTGVNIPVDRLPDIKPPVPTMITVFVVAFQPANAFTNQPVAVFYPNTVYTPPGATGALLTLDPTHGQMVPYGTGTVSNDATQVVPDPDPANPGHRYGLVHFDWHMVGTPLGNQANPCDCTPCPCLGHPVDLSSGLEVIHETDISFGGARGTVSVTRTYRNGINPAATTFGPFGYGTNHNWGYELDSVNPASASAISLIMPDGNRFPFSKQVNGTFVNLGMPVLSGAVMTVVSNTTVDLRWKDGSTFRFVVILSPPFFRTLLDSITDSNGSKFQIVHNGFQIQAIVDPTGRALTFNYNVGGQITQITAPDGTFVSYDYRGNSTGPLRQVTRPDGSITQYSYDVFNNLTSVTDEHGNVFASLTYNSDNRVVQERLANGGVLQFAYTLQNPLAGMLSPVLATTVTDALGNQSVYRFAANQAVLGVTDPLGRMRIIDRDSGNFVVGLHGTGSCPICGDVTAGDQSFSYDDSTGNLLSYTDGLGNTTTFGYDPVFNKLTSIRDPLSNVTTFTLDSHGNRLTQKDPDGNVTSYGYDPLGELVRLTDALKHTASFFYDSFGNIASIKDPQGNVTSFQYDANGRVLKTQDALGRETSFTYDGANRITSQTNAQNTVTRFAYDERGNLTSLTNGSSQTSFTYDLMNQLLTRTDPVRQTDQRIYDLNGNLTQFVDRRGQTSAFAYDVVNRLTMETYSDATVARSYDANDRLSEANDSVGGVFSFSYDAAGRILASTTPLGAIHYTRDALGRVTSRQVAGQPAVTYTYDPAGNLSSAAMPQLSANFTYDARNDLSSINRLNGVSSTFAYDQVARLISITHAKGASVIDAETYSYDQVGNRTSHGTTLGQSLITPAVPSALYNSGNEEVQFGPTANTFDANGNLVSAAGASGTTTYSWDGRNRLKAIAAPNGQTTGFAYDFAGNLIRQADSGTSLNLTKSFVLDSLTNVAYEAASDGTSYSVLSGQSIDSHLAIAQSTGQVQYGLADAINSTVAATDQTGAIKGQFLYDPFGQTTTTATYPFQFSGRMPVSSTAYYYRARFYNAATSRFISEDPIGFAGGDFNLYRYVLNAPTSLVDPLGLVVPPQWPPSSGRGTCGFPGQPPCPPYNNPYGPACQFATLVGCPAFGPGAPVCSLLAIPACHVLGGESWKTYNANDACSATTFWIDGWAGLAVGGVCAAIPPGPLPNNPQQCKQP